MHGTKSGTKTLITLHQVMNIGFCVIAAGIAITFLIKWGEVIGILAFHDVDSSMMRHDRAMSGKTSWKNTIKHIDTLSDTIKKHVKRTDTHEISWLVIGKEWHGQGNFVVFGDTWFTNRSTTDGETLEW